MLLLISVLLLVVIGTSMIYSASSVKAEKDFQDSHFFLKRQLFRVLVGLVMMVIFVYIDYHDLQRYAWLLLLVSFMLLLLVLVAGRVVNGSRRAIYLMNFAFQPSEMAKYSLVLFLSGFLANRKTELKNFTDGLLPALIVIAVIIIPILLEPDLGTSVITLTISAIILFVSGISLYHLAAIAVPTACIITLILFNVDYQRHRLMTFIDTIRGVIEPPWQILQSLICFSNGGIWGMGLGNSRQKLFFLPQPFTDFIYSIIGEEMGFIGAVVVLALFLIIFWRGMWIALNAKDPEGRLLAVGITFTISIYAFVSMGIAVNLLPVTGIPLPFISYGGSALIMNFIAIGILLNISRQCNGAMKQESSSSRRKTSRSQTKRKSRRSGR